MNQDIFVLVEHFGGKVTDITFIMLAQARQLATATGGKSVAVLLGSAADGLAKNLEADQVLYIDDPALAEFTGEAYTTTLAGLLQDKQPRLMLFGDTTIGADIASKLSARMNLPTVSYCLRIEADGGSLKSVSQICGGKIMTEAELPEETVLAAMLPGSFKVEEGQSSETPAVEKLSAPDLSGLKMTFKQYIEPDASDIDISTESILVAIGRGIEREDNVELAEELAKALGGAVCASRPVVDQNWLPTTRLVGKSGKTVKAKAYLALGISGAPEHSEAITSSDLIIAVNTDPTAPIFGTAKYGVEADMLDLMEALTEKIQDKKGG